MRVRYDDAYDEKTDCLKIYTSTDNGATFGWKCYNVQGCPDNW